MSAVLDASTLILAALADARDGAAGHARSIQPALAERYGLRAPALLAWEVGHVVHRKAPASFGRAARDRSDLVQLIIEGIELVAPDRDALVRTGGIAEREGLSFYDAAYLELAARDDEAPLVTEDAALLAAARRVLGKRRAFDSNGAADAVARGVL